MKINDKQTKEAEKSTKDFLKNTGANEIWHIDENGKLNKPPSRIRIDAAKYNAGNGIVICCKSCGSEFEETLGGAYPPIEFEDERTDRRCRNCIDIYGK